MRDLENGLAENILERSGPESSSAANTYMYWPRAVYSLVFNILPCVIAPLHLGQAFASVMSIPPIELNNFIQALAGAIWEISMVRLERISNQKYIQKIDKKRRR